MSLLSGPGAQNVPQHAGRGWLRCRLQRATQETKLVPFRHKHKDKIQNTAIIQNMVTDCASPSASSNWLTPSHSISQVKLLLQGHDKPSLKPEQMKHPSTTPSPDSTGVESGATGPESHLHTPRGVPYDMLYSFTRNAHFCFDRP